MAALTCKHNAEHNREHIDEWTSGKYEYIIIAHCLVWHEQQQREYSERVEIELKTDFKKYETTRSDVKEIVVLRHYARLPYPDFLDLAKPKRGGNEKVSIELDTNADMRNLSFENLAAYECPSP